MTHVSDRGQLEITATSAPTAKKILIEFENGVTAGRPVYLKRKRIHYIIQFPAYPARCLIFDIAVKQVSECMPSFLGDFLMNNVFQAN